MGCVRSKAGCLKCLILCAGTDKGATPVAVLSDAHGLPGTETPKSVASRVPLEVCDGSARHKAEEVLNGDAGGHASVSNLGQEFAGEELRDSPPFSGSGQTYL